MTALKKYEFVAGDVEVRAPGRNTKTHDLLSIMVGLFLGHKQAIGYKPDSVIDKVVNEAVEHLKDWPYPEATPQECQEPVSPRHPVVIQWRDNAIEACAKIADAYGHEYAAQDMRCMLTAPQQVAQEPVAWRYKFKEDLQWQYTQNQEQAHRLAVIEPLYTTPQPAPQGETNAQLDTDSNSPTPGQQRDVAGPVAVGQPVGHGSDSTAGDPSAQRNKLLTVAERNIRSFLRGAVFKSESDREAALNCVDVLWEATRAPADGVLDDAAFEAVRKKLCALPRFSFLSDGYGAVRRVPDKSGSWIAFDAAHALFDPVAVDATLAAQGSKPKCVGAA